jgi:hypothetical protein
MQMMMIFFLESVTASVSASALCVCVREREREPDRQSIERADQMKKCSTADLSVGFGACGDLLLQEVKKKATNNVQCSRRSPMSSHPI